MTVDPLLRDDDGAVPPFAARKRKQQQCIKKIQDSSARQQPSGDSASGPGRNTSGFRNESRFSFLFCGKPKNSSTLCMVRTEKKSVRPTEKFPDCFQTSDSHKFLSHGDCTYRIYRMRYRIYRICRMRYRMRSHAISHLSHLSHAIMQAAPYSGTSSVRTILNDGCSTTFVVVDVAGEAADEAEEEASTVLPRRVVVVDANRSRRPGAARARPWWRRSGRRFCVPLGGGGGGDGV